MESLMMGQIQGNVPLGSTGLQAMLGLCKAAATMWNLLVTFPAQSNISFDPPVCI
ncbi:hypothetical protein PM082_023392 [Marasmius tenuissimus]|nr:hypothetical protein PM082_023392 [Marasmius tenuissimus]